MASISQEEEKATKQFIKVVNEIRLQHNAGPMSFNTGLKFMMARKFDVHRALSLYEAHEITRFREGLAKFDPLVDPVKTELETGKFTVLPTRDSSGAAIAIFTACKHIPTDTSHQTTLQGVVYQLDIALEDVQTQRSGIVFVYNMSNSKYANFDYELSQKILGLLKGAYPARLKKVLIVTAPLWFKAPFKILRLFVREKLRDRVFMINVSQLPHHIPLSSLPKDLGGHYEADHASWIKHCYENGSKTNCDLYDLASFSKFSLSSSSATQMQNGAIFCVNCTNNVPGGDSSGDLSQLPSANGSFSDDDEDSSSTASGKGEVAGVKATNGRPERGNNIGTPGVQNSKPKPENIQVIMPETSPHSFVGKASGGSVSSSSNGGGAGGGGGNSGMSLEEFIQYMKSKGRKGLYEEYNEIKSKMPAGTFDTSRLRVNQPRNRYTDVLCYDHSIVKLAVKEGELGDPTEYINANFVDGYEQKNAFISTQGPLPKTFVDFWKMVWQQNVCVIVMTTRTIERCRTKCGQYWPLELNTDMKIGPYQIFNNGVEQLKDYVISSLVVSEIDTGLTREVAHMQFTSWPDYGVPHSALAMLDFRDRVRTQQAKSVEAMGALWKGHPMGPPIVVHCSAGIGRTGTFITLDISILRLEATGTINIKSTVEKIRAQRAYSIQMPDQYVFCYLALLEYALVQGLLQDVDLSGFEESESEFEE